MGKGVSLLRGKKNGSTEGTDKQRNQGKGRGRWSNGGKTSVASVSYREIIVRKGGKSQGMMYSGM